ncbi:MAG: hypothetical protein KA771_07970 [Spirochaetales bacterium]|nr:hypothetical protein [Spirochaetales bacterium]
MAGFNRNQWQVWTGIRFIPAIHSGLGWQVIIGIPTLRLAGFHRNQWQIWTGIFRQLYLKDRNNWKGDNQYLNFLSNLSSLKETTIGHLAVDLPYSSYNSNKGYLLKLHGSIDWFYCANQNCRAFDKAFPLLEYSKDHYCSECHSIVKALIIPPVLYKNYNEHSIIQILWNTAEREINLAEDILFWGYSLPYTDFYSNWLLRKTKPILNSITIIDPGVIRKKDPPTLNFQFIRHLISPIKNKMKEKKIILYEYFNDYLENSSIEKKIPTQKS